MFCIKCGRKASVGVFCDDCFLSQNELFEIKDFSLVFCDCGAYYTNRWERKGDLEDIIMDAIERKTKIKGVVKDKDIRFRVVNNRVLVSMNFKGFIKPCKKKKAEKKEITITMKKRKCDVCSKLLGGYYEAVIQLRGTRKDKLLKKLKAFPNIRVEGKKEGYDVKFFSKKDANDAIGKLGLKAKTSFKFVGTKKGKRIYRKYYAVR